MILTLLILIPLVSSIFSLFINNKTYNLFLNTAMTILSLTVCIFAFLNFDANIFQIPWMPFWGVNIDLRLDSLSFIMIAFTHLMNILGLLVSYNQYFKRENIFYFLFMLIFTAANGIFLSFDLFLFFIFWELILIPLYFVILIYGGVKKYSTSTIFLLVTQSSGLCLFLGIIILTFQGSQESIFVAILFLIAFLVKLAIFPFHIWLPRVLVFAPVSVLFVGVFVKMGVYGILRFFMPIFPESAFYLTPVMFILGLISLLYGAMMAFAQKDVRRLLAYLTVSHMGAILIGLFSSHQSSIDGALLLSLAQGICIGGIFFVFGFWQKQGISMELYSSSGMLSVAPKSTSLMLFFCFALIGLPGLAPFIGEFYILFGAFYSFGFWTVFIMLGLFLGVVAVLWMIYLLVFGEASYAKKTDFSFKERVILGLVASFLIGVGLYPEPLLNLITRTAP